MKKVWGFGWISFLSAVVLGASAAFLARNGNYGVAYFNFGVAALTLIISVVQILLSDKHIKKIVTRISKDLSSSESNILNDLRLPVIMSSDGEAVWYNSAYEKVNKNANSIIGRTVEDIFGTEIIENLRLSGSVEIFIDDKIFKVHSSIIRHDKDNLEIFYLLDRTKLRKITYKYEQSRPVVAVIMMDNIDEITSAAKDSEIAAFRSSIQSEIEKWLGKTNGISRNLSGDKYLLILEERQFATLLEEKFSVLAAVRELKFRDRSASLSIGVGRGGENLQECQDFAVQALDMALGRGGDQAVIKMPDNEYKFFGGVNGSVEKRTKVKSRIISTALKEMILGSEKVFIMGHRFSDNDSVGAAYGLYSVCRTLGKEAHIVVDRSHTMASLLINRIESMDSGVSFTNGNILLPLADKDTLLIIVDVHRPTFCESPDLLKVCKNVVVIDHHRKAVDHIENAAIFYNEPAASSSCEMVTEILQYINPRSVTQTEAEALLSGIMLDSRNYVLHTGVRTFEASAFLRNHGADPVAVKKLFSGTMPAYRQRATIVASAELYSVDCAIAVDYESNENTKLSASQAADELLGINGVVGSFVLFTQKGEVNISARSLGNINVQLIMEALGGGGHRTMAACQIKNCSLEDAKQKLKTAIDEYKENL